MKRLVLTIFGSVLIFIGLIGLVLPIMPGWILIFSGLSFIAPGLARRLKKKLFRKLFKKKIIRIEDWKKRGIDAGITTRHSPIFLSKTDDLLNPIHQENLKKQFPFLTQFVLLNQVHGANVAVLEGTGMVTGTVPVTHLMNTDGVITNVQGLLLLVLTADCLPIYFVAGEWIGLAHAGWRGTKQGIAGKTFQLLLEKSKCSSKEVYILFGPCICRDHYEVGEEFKQYFPKTTRVPVTLGDWHLRGQANLRRGTIHRAPTFDLARENRRQLFRAGALAKNLQDLEICTVCENSDFYSYRKEKEAAGRLISFIRKI